MPHRLALFMSLLLLGGSVVRATEPLHVRRTIQDAAGRPVNGAQVLVRTFADGQLLAEVAGMTDATGTISLTVPHAAALTPFATDYLLVDAPDCALAFGRLTAPEGLPPLTLQQAFPLEGMVVELAGQAPVVGAVVSVVQVNGVAVNVPSAGVRTPALLGTSGPAGGFRLRGITSEWFGTLSALTPMGTAMVGLAATATAGEGTLMGVRQFSVSHRPAIRTLQLARCARLEGRLLDEQGTPVRNARVRILGDPQLVTSAVPEARTDIEGQYRFPALPQCNTLYVQAAVPERTLGFTPVPWPERTSPAQPYTGTLTAPDMTVIPLLTLTGTISDATSKTVPVTPIELFCTYNIGVNDPMLGWVGQAGTHAPMAADGSFSLRLPAGRRSLTLVGPGYRGEKTLKIPPTPEPVALTVTRRKGLLLRAETTHAQRFAGCLLQLRPVGGTDMRTLDDPEFARTGYWFYPVALPGDGRLEVRVLRDRQEACPWTPLDPEAWPNTLSVQ
jgi:hypothetical protein